MYALVLAMLMSTPSAAIAPAPIVGYYVLNGTFDGSPMKMALRISRPKDKYEGVFYSAMGDTLPATIVVNGDHVTVTTAAHGMNVEMSLVINGDSVKGKWSAGEIEMDVTGSRAPDPGAKKNTPALLP